MEIIHDCKKSEFKVLYLNVHCICNRIDELVVQIEVMEFDLIPITGNMVAGRPGLGILYSRLFDAPKE